MILLDDLEPIKFLFLMCDENKERYFPAHRLLSNIVCDSHFIKSKIEPYHINILQLAVEMFKITGEEDPQKQFEQLINTCHLKFINYLDGKSIRVDTVDMANYKHNNVMVFYNREEKTVLIRHENENYFKDLPEDVIVNHEVNSQQTIIGHSVELPVDGVVIDYSEAIKENPIEFLDLIYARNCKNVLIEKMIVKTSDGRYVPLNPFCQADKRIVKGRIDKRNGKVVPNDHLIECLDECRLQMLFSNAKCNGIDQVNIGLCVYLLENASVSLEELLSVQDGLDSRQNTIIRNWVKLTGSKSELLEIALEKWVGDLDYCNRDETIMKYSFEKTKIRDVLPLEMNMKWIYEVLGLPEDPSIFIGTISFEDDDNYYIDFSPRANRSLAKISHNDINGVYSEEVILSENTNEDDIFQDQMQGCFVYKDGKWYYDESEQNLLKIIVNIELLNDRLIKGNTISYFSDNRCCSIFECMELHVEELLDVDIKNIDPISMYTYRLMHNILLNRINESNAKEYIDLIIKQQKLSFSDINKDELFYKDDGNTLIIPKDKLEADAVLRKVYNKYIRKHASRDDLWWFFPEGLSEKNGVYYKNNQRIKVFRFLFDNTEYGTATLRTIAANIGKEEEWIAFEKKNKDESSLRGQMEKQKRSSQAYTMGETVVKPVQIFNANKPKIVVHSYYGTNEGDKKIIDFFKACGFNDDKYDVSHKIDIVRKATFVKNESQKLGLDYEHNSNIFIVIREFNMTKKTLMPNGAVGDSEKVSVLFVKKDEGRN